MITLVAEIGSTTTVVNAFTGLDGENPRFIGQGFASTTVEAGDVLIGLNQAVESLEQNLGQELKYDEFFATSSAAGGLKMTVHGLVYDMTVKAAREAALGAGAVLKFASAGYLTENDLTQILQIKPNIILLAGGVDYGDKTVVLSNAKTLQEWLLKTGLKIPIIYAGNSAAADEINQLFNNSGLKIYPVENVYPSIDQLNVEPTRKVIQQVFEEHITRAPGMARIRERVQGEIMPTPGAVMLAAKSLYGELGDLLVVDVGGATTDIHSITEGTEEISRMLISPEPVAKRTVEGDLGVFVNAQQIFALIGTDKLTSRYGEAYFNLLKPIPKLPEEINLSRELTSKAVEVAVKRHAGRLISLYGSFGRNTYAQGKDLTKVQFIIGTGGALTRLPSGREILGAVISDRQKELLPRNAEILLDNSYLLASLGVLSLKHPQGALRLMQDTLGINR
jgi:uncharacterized protein (TIGR01319 family)